MPYFNNGSLTTDKREVAIDTTWDTQTDWEAYQSASQVDVTNGVVSLAEGSVFDAFNDTDYSLYSGDTGAVSTSTSTVYEGSGSANLNPGTGAVQRIWKSENALQQDQTLSVRHYIETSAGSFSNVQIPFFVTDANNMYIAQLTEGQDEIAIVVIDGGNMSTLNSTAINVPVGSWISTDVTPESDGTITFILYDSAGSELARVSATDTIFTSGATGIGAYEINTFFDYMVVQ